MDGRVTERAADALLQALVVLRRLLGVVRQIRDVEGHRNLGELQNRGVLRGLLDRRCRPLACVSDAWVADRRRTVRQVLGDRCAAGILRAMTADGDRRSACRAEYLLLRQMCRSELQSLAAEVELCTRGVDQSAASPCDGQAVPEEPRVLAWSRQPLQAVLLLPRPLQMLRRWLVP